MTRPSRQRSIAFVFALTAMSAMTGCDNPLVFQDSKGTASIYEEQASEWTRWALAQPHSTASPIADETGEFCAVDQSGKVWYLAGTFGGPVERSCSIPGHRYLFFPLVNVWGINPDTSIDDEPAQVEFIEFFEEYFADRRARTCELTLRLDGEDLIGTDVEHLDELLYVDVLEPFEVDINHDNWATDFGLAGGITPTLTNGHFALLRPLEPGEHVLEFGAVVCDGEAIEFETSAVYNLVVD